MKCHIERHPAEVNYAETVYKKMKNILNFIDIPTILSQLMVNKKDSNAIMHRIILETGYIFQHIIDTGKINETDEKTIEDLRAYLLQYENISGYEIKDNASKKPDRNITNYSIRLAIILGLWSEYSERKIVYYLLFYGGGVEKAYEFDYMIEVIRSWLEVGLCYDTYRPLFDQVLEKRGLSQALLFPKERYPSTYARRTYSSVQMLLRKGKNGHLFERPMPELIKEILKILEKNCIGVYPYYCRPKKGRKELLCALIVKKRHSYFYIKAIGKHYEFEAEKIQEAKSESN